MIGVATIKRDSPERIALIAEEMGIPADAPMVEWGAEGTPGGAWLTVTLKKHVSLERVNEILNT